MFSTESTVSIWMRKVYNVTPTTADDLVPLIFVLNK